MERNSHGVDAELFLADYLLNVLTFVCTDLFLTLAQVCAKYIYRKKEKTTISCNLNNTSKEYHTSSTYISCLFRVATVMTNELFLSNNPYETMLSANAEKLLKKFV